jgi:hypothetical protein
VQSVVPECEKVKEECRKLHAEKLCEMYSPSHIIRMVKQFKEVKWARHTMCTG